VSSLDGTRTRGHQLDLYLEDKDEEVARAAHHLGMKTGGGNTYAPGNGLTVPVPRLKDDLAALIRLTNFLIPPLRVVRPSQVVPVFYGFGDALAKQFGVTISRNYNCKSQLAKGVKVKTSNGV
jgi:hypothetical protein